MIKKIGLCLSGLLLSAPAFASDIPMNTALLRGLDKLISTETKIPVNIAANPLDCVADGTGICLENDNLNMISNKKYI